MARKRVNDKAFNPFAPRSPILRQNWTCPECKEVNSYEFEECDWCGADASVAISEDNQDSSTEVENPFFQHSGTITMYYRSSYFGQDSEEVTRGENTYQQKPTRGLTQWAADNYELLDLGNQGIGDERKVNQDNRASWSKLAEQFLHKLYPLASVRTCFRKSTQYRDSDQWDMFPHPEDAIARNLGGTNGELPVARVIIQKSRKDPTVQWMILSAFTSQVINELDKNDLILHSRIDMETRDDVKIWDMVSIPGEFATKLRAMESTKQNIDSRMSDWIDYLDTMYDLNRRNEWGAKIVDIKIPTSDDPFYQYTLVAPEAVLNRVMNRRNRGGTLHGITNNHSKNEDIWIRKEESQDLGSTRSDEADAGNYVKLLGKPQNLKDGMKEFRLRVEPPNQDDLFSGLTNSHIGQFLINDVSRDLFQIKRQSDGLKRLKELEASHNNVHDWLFDIGKAKPGMKIPPALEYKPLAPLNEEQERAVRAALNAPDVFLIQGPPGTGKTTVIAEIINQATEDGKKVLLASQSNLAVDNALARLPHTPNVRPIRRFARSAAVDPEAEVFLESNVITDFFIPSIREHCGNVFEDSELLRTGKESVIRCRNELDDIKNQWREQSSKLLNIEEQRKVILDNENDIVYERNQMLSRSDTVSAAINLNDDGRPDLITQDMAHAIGIDNEVISALKNNKTLQERDVVIGRLLNILTKLPSGGTLDPEILKLREDKDKAVEEENYELAGQLKNRISELSSSSSLSDDEWTNWTRDLSRLVDKETIPELFKLTKSFEAPDNLDTIVNAVVEELREEKATIESELFNSKDILEDIISQLSSKLQSIQNDSRNNIEQLENKLEQSKKLISQHDESKKLIQRKLDDSTASWNQILQGLPDGIIDATSIDIAGTDTEKIVEAGNDWLKENQSEIESNEIWREIRKDWLKDLENPKKSTLRDLEQMYKRMINIEGVTTSFAGKKGWYMPYLQEPFDFVIIDEISKATPPEILLPLLLGKKAILVGDHRQLPPTFKNPKSREEITADEMEDERFARGGKFENMVTSALFAEYFKYADETLKSTLTVQYRMHEQIMRCTNEFYEGKLSRGLSEQEQDKKKQHGFTIVKNDSGGSGLREGSELIVKEQHAIWIDSTFDRDGRYCSEESPSHTTSRRNVREVRIAKYMIAQFEQQVAERKEEVPQENWPEDSMLQHLDHEDRLPIGFITFYGDQKNAFREIANENDSWVAMRNRWPNLSVKVDTVDKFQGGEKAVIFVSMVVSPEIKEEKRDAFEKKVQPYSYNPKKIQTKNGFHDGGIPKSGTSFIKSPERINVAFSRAQNLLIVLGNRFALSKNDVEIIRDNGSKVKKPMYKQIQEVIGQGGMIDGRDML